LPLFADFLREVSYSSPTDLPVFKDYFDQALTQEFFGNKHIEIYYGKFLELMETMALSGLKVDGPAFFKYITLVKEKISMSTKE
jgi:hypothetical protein